MIAQEVLNELDRLGIMLEAHGDRLKYSPRSAVTPEIARRLRIHKPALLALLSGKHWSPDVSSDANESYWQAVDPVDRDYLLSPREEPVPCQWCGGRLVHSAACKELRREWVPNLPFGKYRGRRIDEVPADYIDCVLSAGVGRNGFRDEVRLWRESLQLDCTSSIGYSAVMGKKRVAKLTDQIRRAIDDSGITRYRIAQDTGIDESTLAKFYNGTRGLSLNNLDLLSSYLGLRVVMDRKTQEGR